VPLVSFSTVDRSALRWLRTGGRTPEYTLLAGESAVAVVRWERPRGARAAAELADRKFVLEREGLFVSHLTIRPDDEAPPVARLTNHLGYHEISLGGDGVYRLRRAGLLVPAWTVTDSGGAERLHIEPVAEGGRLGGGAVLTTGAVPPPELLVLTILAWYLIVLLWREDEAIEALGSLESRDAPP
jgi:hypothetical protein